MTDLKQSLLGADFSHLRAVAESWKLPFDAPDAREGLDQLTEGLLKTFTVVGESKNMAYQSFWNKVQDFSKPLIAAIDGVCTAGGLELVMRCDIRVVAETAEIRDLHLKNLGILGGGGLQTWLPRLINVGKAKELIWTGDPIDGHVQSGQYHRRLLHSPSFEPYGQNGDLPMGW